MKDHMAELGFRSTSAYLLWCKRSGFETRLEKTPEERKRELAYHRLQPPSNLGIIDKGPHRLRTERIKDIFRGELSDDKLPDILSRIRRVYDTPSCATPPSSSWTEPPPLSIPSRNNWCRRP